jgi:hypothetical protein
MDLIELDDLGRFQNLNDEQIKMILGCYIIVKVLIASILCQPKQSGLINK